MLLELAGVGYNLHDETQTDFDQEFMKSAMISLGNILGPDVANAAIKALCKDSPTVRAESIFPNLNRLFGVGASVISKIMLRDFYAELDIPWEERSPADHASMLVRCRKEFLAKRVVSKVA